MFGNIFSQYLCDFWLMIKYHLPNLYLSYARLTSTLSKCCGIRFRFIKLFWLMAMYELVLLTV